MAYTDSYGVKFSNDQEVIIKCPDNFEGSYIIPDSVTKIDRDAFSGCSGLTSIVIPDSVTKIDSDAFSGCSGLTSIVIPNSVTEIGWGPFGWGAFRGCSRLKEINVSPQNVAYTSDDGVLFNKQKTVLVRCPEGKVGNYFIPNGITRIAARAFSGCSELTAIPIPNSVTIIGYDTFSGCSGLTAISIPNSVTEIGSGAFSGCSELTAISIPNGVRKIGYDAFRGCSGLTTISIPNGVTEIGYGAFSGCSELTTISIPDGVTEIGYGAFSSCSELTAISIPNGVRKIGYDAFRDCSGLTTISIPDGVTEISETTFHGCSSLTSITIPSSLTEMKKSIYDWGLFKDCSSLTEISVSSQNTVYASHEGVLFNKQKTVLVRCPEGKVGNYLIPNGVTKIDYYAFSGCSGLTSIVIPNSVTEIDRDAFSGCSGLTAISIPDSVTEIADSAFRGCSGLTSIVIPNSVTKIDRDAFSGCSGLTAISIPNSVTEIADLAFRGCSGLTAIPIPNSVTIIGSHAFSGCSGLTAISIPDSVTEIADSAFRGCSRLSEINVSPQNMAYASYEGVLFNKQKTVLVRCPEGKVGNYFIPNGITKIDYYAFSGCSGLTAISIPNSVTEIADLAFRGCSGLTAIPIPNSVTIIGSHAFSGCSGLTAISIPNSVTEIGSDVYGRVTKLICVDDRYSSSYSSAFYDCSGLTEINVSPQNIVYASHEGVLINKHKSVLVCYPEGKAGNYLIPNGVKKIDNDAFRGRIGLTAISIPNGVTEIGGDAFSGCSGLTDISIPDSVTEIGWGAFRGCSRLKEINVSPQNMAYTSDDGVLFNKQKTVLVRCPEGKVGNYFIPNGVKKIDKDAFSGCSELTAISIPNGVTEIGSGAFSGCSGLTSIVIPNSVTEIDRDAFSGCSGLNTITIPKGTAVKFIKKNMLRKYQHLFVEQDNELLTTLNTLAKAYEKGIGVTRNTAQAVLFYTQAAEEGSSEAAYRLGELYEEGELLPQNITEAIRYYAEAAKRGYKDAATRQNNCETQLEKTKQLAQEELAEQAKKIASQEVEASRTNHNNRSNLLLFDTETNGLPANYNAPVSNSYNWPRLVQLAWIVTDTEGNVLKDKCYIIKPVGFTIPNDVVSIHGITTEKALREGHLLESVIREFLQDAYQANILVGHNLDFDKHIVGAELYRLGKDYEQLMNMTSVCTMLSSIQFCKLLPIRYGEYKWPKLQELHYALFAKQFEDAHNAAADIHATKKCYFELKKRGII